mmetsp:Transcript_57878/g.163391  ORF Transcript_57878/g.163391 Transcript_57878/m.163391 type:complete len:321 (-) Transcript_57878:872-1834(-)
MPSLSWPVPLGSAALLFPFWPCGCVRGNQPTISPPVASSLSWMTSWDRGRFTSPMWKSSWWESWPGRWIPKVDAALLCTHSIRRTESSEWTAPRVKLWFHCGVLVHICQSDLSQSTRGPALSCDGGSWSWISARTLTLSPLSVNCLPPTSRTLRRQLLGLWLAPSVLRMCRIDLTSSFRALPTCRTLSKARASTRAPMSLTAATPARRMSAPKCIGDCAARIGTSCAISTQMSSPRNTPWTPSPPPFRRGSFPSNSALVVMSVGTSNFVSLGWSDESCVLSVSKSKIQNCASRITARRTSNRKGRPQRGRRLGWPMGYSL